MPAATTPTHTTAQSSPAATPSAAIAASPLSATTAAALPRDCEIAVLCGAVSPEREVSLRSGRAVAAALAGLWPGRVTLHELDANALPPALAPARHVVFPVIHGDYGEDGAIQAELEARGFAYAGCAAAASRVCIDKAAAKERFRAAGASVSEGLDFAAAAPPAPAAFAAALGTDDIILKPADKGSSVGLRFARGTEAIARALAEIQTKTGRWLAEARVTGREMTIGILDGEALGIVEIRPRTGRYDYETKYASGASEYLFPAPVPAATAARAAREAEAIFAACGCRDFARADFILRDDGTPVFLEINTMPGMTSTSLFPKSASCGGARCPRLDFASLCERMLSPALQRFAARA